ncbi:MAG: PQQ-binding-like beta-propeller repeat protein [Planctomycetes bacterium]|nr:PQQ-binding-like beta-propeller repeat protein [Planctomycetota bacterium]
MRQLAKITIGMVCVWALTLSPAARGADWANWRGPNHDGSSPETDLPVEFSQTQNVKWAVDLPGPSAATPIITGDRVFITSSSPADKKLFAMCFDRTSGKLLWQQQVGTGYQHPYDNRSTFATPSPVTDGKVVIFLYGNGDLAGFTVEGKKLWQRNLQDDYGQFTYQWTFSASPTILYGQLLVQVLQRDQPVHDIGKDGNESYILALEPATGKTIYRHVRPSDAKMESHEAYSTPMPFEKDGVKQYIVLGGDVVTSHEADTGKELWRWGTYNPDHREQWWRVVPSPVIGDGIILACAPKKAPIFAVRAADGTLAWQSEDRGPLTSDVPTPLFYQGRFFIMSDVRKALSRVEPATGKIEWSIELPGRYLWRASPTGADGHIYCVNHHGEVIVVDPADGKIVAHNMLGKEDDDGICASIAVANGNLFVRTNSKLFCVGR